MLTCCKMVSSLLIHYSFLVICYVLHETFDGIQQRSGKARLATTRAFEIPIHLIRLGFKRQKPNDFFL